MGFLDHSTNSIILDATLTDKGRELMSRNDGSFAITKFALSDDEVDYDMIKQYGRSVGKEKIEKNTPVFEGLTNQTQALKYKLLSLSVPDLIRLPHLSFTSPGTTVSLTRGVTTDSSITVEQSIASGENIDVELSDRVFQISLNNLFLQISDDTPDSIDFDNTAFYTMPSTETLSNGGSSLSFKILLKSLTDSYFTIYGDSDGKIKTFVKVTGLQSGTEAVFQVQIQNTSTS